MPLFVWTILIYSYLIIIAISSFTATLAMLLVDRQFDGTFFDPTAGGAPLLWQHLFWFMGHPEVYIMVLPGLRHGERDRCRCSPGSRCSATGRSSIATAAIGFLGLLVWAHHMFAAPLATAVLGFFMLSARSLIAVPTGIKIFNWLATMWRGNIEFRVPLLFVVRGIAQFVVGGATGVILAVFPDRLAADRHLLRRRAHALRPVRRRRASGSSAGLHYWFPKMTGRHDERAMGEGLVLADGDRLQPDVPAAALCRHVGNARAAWSSTRDECRADRLQPRLDDRLLHHRARRGGGARQRLLEPPPRGGLPETTPGGQTRSNGSRPRRRPSTTST